MQQSVATSNDTNQAFGNNNEDKREHSISQNRGNFATQENFQEVKLIFFFCCLPKLTLETRPFSNSARKTGFEFS